MQQVCICILQHVQTQKCSAAYNILQHLWFYLSFFLLHMLKIQALTWTLPRISKRKEQRRVAFTCAVQMMVISNKISKKGPEHSCSASHNFPEDTKAPVFWDQLGWRTPRPRNPTKSPFNYLNSRETITTECSYICMRCFVLGLWLEDSGTV